MAESEELKSLLMRVKEENAKAGLKLNSKKKKTNKDPGILSHHFMTNKREKSGSSEIFFPLCSKITLDGDCSHEIKRHLLLGRKAMTNLDGILKSRDIILPTKVHIVAMVFPVVMNGCENWIIKKAE